MTLGEMKSLGREALIEIGIRRLQENEKFEDFDRAYFDRIQVRENGEDIWVSFDNSIRFIPLNTSTSVSVSVYIYGQRGYSYQEITNPPEILLQGGFPILTEDQAQMRETVLNIIGYVSGAAEEATVTITENKDSFSIEEMGTSEVTIFQVQKDTWEIFEEIHEELDLHAEVDEIKEIR
ncbi:MAG: hypothetical protein HN368_24290 [Spirochaetales bacterium]|jgi:hypothetical protein|nr:hypothetical protein [Spirochaetales bacterium]